MPKTLNIKLLDAEERRPLLESLRRNELNHINWRADSKVTIISPRTINRYIEEELIHDQADILNLSGQTLGSMSSGERKKAYLNYVLAKNPELLVLDHYFDSLDIISRSDIRDILFSSSSNCELINIHSRTEDRLDFAHNDWIYLKGDLEAAKNFKEKPPEASQSQKTLPPPHRETDHLAGELVAFKNVSVSYLDKPILCDITWKVNGGEFWHLLGPNGSGKTTLLTMISGDNHKAYGQDITLFGRKKGSGETIWDIRRKVGYFTSNMTFQFKRLQTMRDMIISGFYDSVGLYVIPGDVEVMLADQWLAFLSLENEATKPFIEASLCHQRMIMIARAMVKHPPLLILDEPTVDLDERSIQKMTHLINQIANQSQVAIIYVSHRKDKGIKPTHTFKLKPSESGSTGSALKPF